MKLKFTIVILIGVAFVYSACKTSQITPTAKTTDLSALSSQIAMSLYKSFSGQYGGANINNGIKAPSGLGASRRGPAINGIYDYCGITIDTSYNTPTTAGDTAKVSSGHFNFVYTCSINGLDGYIVADSLGFSATTSNSSNIVKNAQNYTVKALDQTFKLVSMDGNIGTKIYYAKINPASHAITESHDLTTQYILNGVKVDLSGTVGDIITGTASYTTVATDVDATTSATGNVSGYHGLITYSPGHMATVTLQINSTGETKTFSVNMLTGATTGI
jgi:hypothetical protein